MRRPTQALLLVLAAMLAAAAAAGCGGSDNKSAKAVATPAKTTTTTATATTAPTAAAGSAEEAARRLRTGGYTVSNMDVNPPAIAARKVGDHTLLYEYTTPAEAKKGAKIIRTAVSPQPGRGIVATEGRRTRSRRASAPRSRTSSMSARAGLRRRR
jgi:hypothetical protein